MISTKDRAAVLPEAFPFARLLEMQRRGLISFYTDIKEQYGDFVRLKLGPLPVYMVLRPEHVRHVLVTNADNYGKGFTMDKIRQALGNGLFTSEGDLWRRQRRIMQPLFTPRGVTRYADLMVDVAQEMVERWLPESVIPVNAEMMRLAMSVIGRAMFGIDAGGKQAELGEAFTFVLEYAAQRTVAIIDPPLFIPTPGNLKLKRSLQFLDDFIYGMIEKRKREGGEPDDLIGRLMAVQNAESGGITDEQVRDEVITIFFAGHETTAQTLTWAWYLLAKHPQVEARLHEELDRVLNGREPQLDDLHHLPYTRWIIEETLRLYPPAWIIARQADKADRIGEQDIEPNAMIVLSAYLTHRLNDYWETPEQFDPERFEPTRADARPSHAYFPFGTGPRICIGNNFALLEATLTLAVVAQQLKLRLVSDQPAKLIALGTLRPEHEIMMRVERR